VVVAERGDKGAVRRDIVWVLPAGTFNSSALCTPSFVKTLDIIDMKSAEETLG
jgi:hypothetical protein